ncbi:hypothetical protein CYPRO_0722 [Cyclonatronum proteinivorum]|uniref:Dynamin family protein n=1 Tax=Cyclonatronum proteinivorum TaxID=1457365 RepID=A0A345UHQ4_9BACT|nr:hypothetical protein [Cyclonatronum proteinivorum]AXJ00006.1 hypothetical protein CYPRO_0722 [Cyclonatronum proteinivorum]
MLNFIIVGELVLLEPYKLKQATSIKDKSINIMDLQQLKGNIDEKITNIRNILSEDSQTYKQLEQFENEVNLLSGFLARKDHRVAFIGAVGVGKTHAICKLLNLFHENKTSLSTSSGRTTLCEVEISSGEEEYFEVTPHTFDEVEKFIYDFASAVYDEKGSTTEQSIISSEVERVLRRMTGLSWKKEKRDGKPVSYDPVKTYVTEFETKQLLIKDLMSRIDYENRTKTKFYNTDKLPQNEFIQKTFRAINFGSDKHVPLAKKINIYIKGPLLDLSDLDISILDTKGIDQTSNRTDLDECLNDERTLNIFCSRFNDAPDKATTGIIELAVNSGINDDRLNNEAMILVLDRNDEAEKVLFGDEEAGDKEDGREIRKESIRTDLQSLFKSKTIDVAFFDAAQDAPGELQKLINTKIGYFRSLRFERISEIFEDLSQIEKEIHSKTAAEAKKTVLTTLEPWLKKAELAEPEINAYYSDLLEALRSNQVYASSIRASVNRLGDWYNMDFYQHLGASARKQVVDKLESLRLELLYLVRNMLDQNNLQPAHSLLKQLISTTERHFEQLNLMVYSAGREVYKNQLEYDIDLWDKMSAEWGRGPGYKDRISEHASDWFIANDYQQSEQQVKDKINERWSAYLNDMKGLLGKR